jgi:hypothetical protein
MSELEKLQKQLSDPKFLSKAPKDTIEKVRIKVRMLSRPVLRCRFCGGPVGQWMGELWCERTKIPMWEQSLMSRSDRKIYKNCMTIWRIPYEL